MYWKLIVCWIALIFVRICACGNNTELYKVIGVVLSVICPGGKRPTEYMCYINVFKCWNAHVYFKRESRYQCGWWFFSKLCSRYHAATRMMAKCVYRMEYNCKK